MSIAEQIAEYITKELATGLKGQLGPDMNLVGVIDSTGVVELTVWVENTFGFSVEIDDITPENFGTVRRLTEWVRKNGAKDEDQGDDVAASA